MKRYSEHEVGNPATNKRQHVLSTPAPATTTAADSESSSSEITSPADLDLISVLRSSYFFRLYQMDVATAQAAQRIADDMRAAGNPVHMWTDEMYEAAAQARAECLQRLLEEEQNSGDEIDALFSQANVSQDANREIAAEELMDVDTDSEADEPIHLKRIRSWKASQWVQAVCRDWDFLARICTLGARGRRDNSSISEEYANWIDEHPIPDREHDKIANDWLAERRRLGGDMQCISELAFNMVEVYNEQCEPTEARGEFCRQLRLIAYSAVNLEASQRPSSSNVV